MRFLYYSLFFLFSNCLLAQREGNIWYFGNYNGLDFNSGAPVQSNLGLMRTLRGCASICDADGKLLFYTNGGGRDPQQGGLTTGKIWNAANQVIYDMGNTQGGSYGAEQSSVFVPKPSTPGRYLLFTMEETDFNANGPVPNQALGRGLSFFELDALDGKVVEFESSLYVPAYDGLCVVRHANKQDYWLIIIDGNTGALVVFEVTAGGIQQQQSYYSANTSFIKGAPDGRHIASRYGVNDVVVYDFDPATGTISNPELLLTAGSAAEFSPNGRYLYTLGGSTDRVEIYQYDLTTSLPTNTRRLVGGYAGGGNPKPKYTPGQMQVAPDGRIYFVVREYSDLTPVDKTYLSVVICPDNKAAYMDFNVFNYNRDNAADSPGQFYGLPNFDNGIFYRPPATGFDFGADTIRTCNDSVLLDSRLTAGKFSWNTGETTAALYVTKTGMYSLTVTDECNGAFTDSVYVITGLTLNIIPPAQVCSDSLLLTTQTAGGKGIYSYLWNTGSTSDRITVSNSGLYRLTLTDAGGCSTTASYNALITPPLFIDIIPDSIKLDLGEDAVVLAVPGVNPFGSKFKWEPSEGLTCADCLTPTAKPEQTTRYTLTMTAVNGCTASAELWVEVDRTLAFYVPNIFSPNDDGSNDVLSVFAKPTVEAVEVFMVFDRWGNLVYSAQNLPLNDPKAGWRGEYREKDAQEGVYVWRARVRLADGTSKEYSGDVTVIR